MITLPITMRKEILQYDLLLQLTLENRIIRLYYYIDGE